MTITMHTWLPTPDEQELLRAGWWHAVRDDRVGVPHEAWLPPDAIGHVLTRAEALAYLRAGEPVLNPMRIIEHADGWQECAACGSRSRTDSPAQRALGLMGMAHSPDCPLLGGVQQAAADIFGTRRKP